ncbi:MAG TPA: hypothetical protein VK048_01265 [Atopostipes sp.]|nr:hypothetical protein [Atopostipes sp.]
MTTDELTFLAMTTKYSDEEIHDVTVDLEMREWMLEKVDIEGKVLEPQIKGKLRMRSIRKYQDLLNDLDFLSWPLLDESPTTTFPTNIKNSVVLYSFDEEEEYYTTGRSDDDLRQLHKATENLIGQTYGSYAYYDK